MLLLFWSSSNNTPRRRVLLSPWIQPNQVRISWDPRTDCSRDSSLEGAFSTDKMPCLQRRFLSLQQDKFYYFNSSSHGRPGCVNKWRFMQGKGFQHAQHLQVNCPCHSRYRHQLEAQGVT